MATIKERLETVTIGDTFAGSIVTKRDLDALQRLRAEIYKYETIGELQRAFHHNELVLLWIKRIWQHTHQ